jgi:hypothetical protein
VPQWRKHVVCRHGMPMTFTCLLVFIPDMVAEFAILSETKPWHNGPAMKKVDEWWKKSSHLNEIHFLTGVICSG